jgi:soluble P-type ATPase
MIEIAIPGGESLRLAHALLDFNGTLAQDGQLIEGVAERLRSLAARFRIHVVTADTVGTAASALAGLPLSLAIMPPHDQAAAKRAELERLGRGQTVAIGNGRNDLDIIRHAALSIVVVGREGCSARTLLRADIVSPSIGDALDLLLTPGRIVATLRR